MNRILLYIRIILTIFLLLVMSFYSIYTDHEIRKSYYTVDITDFKLIQEFNSVTRRIEILLWIIVSIILIGIWIDHYFMIISP